eukprot:5568813-Pleurochrysis_carterae.AAC.1
MQLGRRECRSARLLERGDVRGARLDAANLRVQKPHFSPRRSRLSLARGDRHSSARRPGDISTGRWLQDEAVCKMSGGAPCSVNVTATVTVCVRACIRVRGRAWAWAR